MKPFLSIDPGNDEPDGTAAAVLMQNSVVLRINVRSFFIRGSYGVMPETKIMKR